MTPDEVWASIAEAELARSDVTAGTGFGKSEGLRVSGKVYAMFIQDELVVKLPKNRVDELISEGDGRRFEPGRGRIMKEWAVLPPPVMDDWSALVAEARTYVNPGGGSAA
ncbi:MAG TPA: hypothetical protein VHI11_03780 [Jiangellaceae bacterium]|nr:hypothetical protein [Jiangellaceae bacterium]